MKKRRNPYKRCKRCKELVIDPDNCANCANRDPMGGHRKHIVDGKRKTQNLDIIEGNEDNR